MRKKAALAVIFLAAPGALRANPSMSTDFQGMMQWLANQTSQGLAFNSGSMFDPPNELRPWHLQPDVSLGVGWVPLDKTKFPDIRTPALADLNPQSVLPDKVVFPNLTLHVRMGLPGRWDVSVRGANMTTPKGYRLSPSTTGDGQSNSLGASLRRHFFGGDDPLLSVSANVNHVAGRFRFYNQYRNLQLVPGFSVDSNNSGELQWSVNSLGVNAVASRTFGAWTPFAGAGYNHMSGSVRARMEAVFATPLILPSVGEASNRPEEHQVRAIFGFQKDGWLFNYFVNAEVKLVGEAKYKTYTVSTGLVAPFRIGALSAKKKSRETPLRDLVRDAPEDGELRDAPAERPATRRSGRRRDDDLPRLIFLQ